MAITPYHCRQKNKAAVLAAYRSRLSGFEAGEALLQEFNCRFEAGKLNKALNLIRNNHPLKSLDRLPSSS